MAKIASSMLLGQMEKVLPRNLEFMILAVPSPGMSDPQIGAGWLRQARSCQVLAGFCSLVLQ